MKIGIPKEIKNHEYRVGLTPESVTEFVRRGHSLRVETGAGAGIGASDEDYKAAGAEIATSAESVFAEAEMIVKVKEPLAEERARLRPDHLLYTYLHLAPDAPQTTDLIASGATCIAYETVTNDEGELPLLKPMSQVAGRLSIQAGAWCLERSHGGRGVLLGGVPGVAPAKVVVVGGGVVGFHAAQMAVGAQAEVSILDRNTKTLEKLSSHFGASARVLYSNAATLEQQVAEADLVIGAVLIPGANAPKLVTRDMLKTMRDGSVLVDVAIDQGGFAETSRATTHADPIFTEEGVIHYCVANMPGAVARTSTYALNNATLPMGLALADKGAAQAIADDPHLANGLNVAKGKVTNEAVAEAHGHAYVSPSTALAG